MRVGDTRMSSLPFSYGSIGGYIAECLAGVRNEDVLCSDRRADKMAVVDRSMDGLLTGKSWVLVANCCLPKHLTQGIINTTTGSQIELHKFRVVVHANQPILVSQGRHIF